MYQSRESCCTYITWAKPHTLLFDDEFRLLRLDPVTQKLTLIAGWSDFVVSPNGRWIAGWSEDQEHAQLTVGVRSVHGKTCLAVPQNSHQTDEAAGFTPDSKNVIVRRWRFNNGPTGSSHLVQYALASLSTSRFC